MCSMSWFHTFIYFLALLNKCCDAYKNRYDTILGKTNKHSKQIFLVQKQTSYSTEVYGNKSALSKNKKQNIKSLILLQKCV